MTIPFGAPGGARIRASQLFPRHFAPAAPIREDFVWVGRSFDPVFEASPFLSANNQRGIASGHLRLVCLVVRPIRPNLFGDRHQKMVPRRAQTAGSPRITVAEGPTREQRGG